MSEFWAMSGYAAYVWPSIGLTLAVLFANVVWARQLNRTALAEARRRIAIKDES